MPGSGVGERSRERTPVPHLPERPQRRVSRMQVMVPGRSAHPIGPLHRKLLFSRPSPSHRPISASQIGGSQGQAPLRRFWAHAPQLGGPLDPVAHFLCRRLSLARADLPQAYVDH
uniref:Uncharacterized protein n=1 Tax=Opuntia streptacantha TaxID=393608 RepID=A0A7C8YYS0_OPUST